MSAIDCRNFGRSDACLSDLVVLIGRKLGFLVEVLEGPSDISNPSLAPAMVVCSPRLDGRGVAEQFGRVDHTSVHVWQDERQSLATWWDTCLARCLYLNRCEGGYYARKHLCFRFL